MKAAVRFLSVSVLILIAGREPAIATSSPSPHREPPRLDSSTWMPDVAERVADLRERARRADQEARARDDADARSGQWWRGTVAAVARETAQ